MATLDILQNTQALGNVRPLAAQIKQADGKDPAKTVTAVQASASATAQLQDQVDKLQRQTRQAVQVLSTSTVTAIGTTGVTIRGNPVTF